MVPSAWGRGIVCAAKTLIAREKDVSDFVVKRNGAPQVNLDRSFRLEPNRMKICFMTASVSRNAGGLFHSVRGLAHSSLFLKNNVFALGVCDAFTEMDRKQWSPIPLTTFRVFGPERFSFAPGLAAGLRAADPDILQLHGLWRFTSVIADGWHRRTGKPYIVHPHGMLDPWAVNNAHWKKVLAGTLYENRTLRNAACIRALCHSEVESIRRYGLRGPVCLLPNGVENAETELMPIPEPLKTPCQGGKRVLLYLGRLHPKKGLVNLLKAWAMAQAALPPAEKASPPWVLAVAGWNEGNHESELKALARELGTEDSVIFLGPCFDREKSACYQHCDAFILPSQSEGLPMVILEAWSYAKPVLMTLECNLPEGFAAGAAIKITTAVDNITQGLNRLFKAGAPELAEMGQKGLRLANERFSWKGIGERFFDVCDWIVHRTAKPDCVYLD